MARPKKIGLDYFPVDVSFNEQIQALESVHGNNGLVWLIKFWQSAYKTEFGEVNLNGLFGNISANNSRITIEQQNKIICDCIQLGLLIEITQGVYSSNGIKKRISGVSKERLDAINRRKKALFDEQSPNNPRTMGESKVKESKEKKINKDTLDHFFEKFWALYPRKVGRGAAYNAWKKTPLPDITVLYDALEWQKKTEQWNKSGGQFIPHPATWINQQRWNDQPMKSEQPKPERQFYG